VCRLAALVAIVATLAACGASGPPTKAEPVVFGVSGGNIAPFRATIEPNGRLSYTGLPKPRRKHLSRAKAASLSRLVQQAFAAGLRSHRCPGTNPDVASGFIRVSGRTVTVHGSCEPRFTKLWETLAHAALLGRG
jgi:hypothetical protein